MPAAGASASGDRLTNALAAVVAMLTLSVAVLFCVYPVYPASGTLCDVLENAYAPSMITSLLPDEWALRYISRGGAVVRVDGVVHGGTPGNNLYFHTPCGGWNLYAGLELPDLAAVSAHTRADLSALPSTDPDEDRMIEASLVARVDRIGGGCFGPSLTMTVLAIETRGTRTVVNRRMAAVRP